MKISQTGINLIKKWEQFRSKAYLCPAGVWTQGYGHTKTVTSTSLDIEEWQAEDLLKTDINVVEIQLKTILSGFKLSQQQYDAIISFCFNLGAGAFKRSNAYGYMIKDINDKRIADSWLTFRNAGGKYLRGLMLRRLDELQLYYS